MGESGPVGVCAVCGHGFTDGEPLTLRGKLVCGAVCFAILSRRDREPKEVLSPKTRRGHKVQRSGYWLKGRIARDEEEGGLRA